MADLPPIKLVATGEFTKGSFVAPNAWHSVQAVRPDGRVVGHVGYGVSPLNDRIYVDGLEVDTDFRRSGYATSILVAVAKRCSPEGSLMPMTALHEVFASRGFWSKLREGAAAGLVVTQDVRASEMDEEASRWRKPPANPAVPAAGLGAIARAPKGPEPER